MSTERRVPAATYLIAGLLVAAVALPVILFSGSEERDPGAKGVPGATVYRKETLLRFRKLLESHDWTLPDPPQSPRGMLEILHVRTGLRFTLVPAGGIWMGTAEREEGRHEDEGPLHPVRVSAFLLSSTECTQAAWDRLGGPDDREWRQARLPIEGVTWAAARAWCGKAGLRLPSEAEWEYACRADCTARWCFGCRESRLEDHAWYDGNSGERSHPVGAKRPNAWGLFDMHGNLWEWCEDVWHDDYRGAPTNGSARLSGDGSYRVLRGGCYVSEAKGCRSANRSCWRPDEALDFHGFRPAADLPE